MCCWCCVCASLSYYQKSGFKSVGLGFGSGKEELTCRETKWKDKNPSATKTTTNCVFNSSKIDCLPPYQVLNHNYETLKTLHYTTIQISLVLTGHLVIIEELYRFYSEFHYQVSRKLQTFQTFRNVKQDIWLDEKFAHLQKELHQPAHDDQGH